MTSIEFTALVSQYQGLVFTICRQMVTEPETAQDLTQETFLSAWRSIDKCPPGYEKQWLARIAANKAKDYLKSAWARKVDAPGDDIMELNATPESQSPEQQVQDADSESGLTQLVLELKEPYKTPARLYFLEQNTVDAVAKLCGRPPKTVSAQLFRAKKILQKQILERNLAERRA